jgi:hypothetical protein
VRAGLGNDRVLASVFVMIVIADGVPLLSTEPIWRRPGLPFGPSLGPPERFPYDPGPFEPSPSGPDWTVEGTLGIPRARHLEAEVLTCPEITLVADPDPLHTSRGTPPPPSSSACAPPTTAA